MKKNTIKQHYVWRDYLRNFSFEKDKIYSLINFENIVPNNLMNVSQEKYFYKLEDISENDYYFLEKFLNNFVSGDNFIKEYLKTILISYKLISLKSEFINYDKRKVEILEDFQKTFFEDIMTKCENYGKDLISIKNLDDIKNCFNEENKFKTILFLCIQLVRTKKQKQKLQSEFSDREYITIDNIWFYISYTIGNILALNLTFTRKFNIKLLNNISSIDFITSDQPIINLKDELDANGNTKYFQMYFPINPKTSIIIDFDVNEYIIEEITVENDDYIEDLNIRVTKKSNLFVLSNSEKLLAKIKNCI